MKARVRLAVDKHGQSVDWHVRSPTPLCELTRAFTHLAPRAFAHIITSQRQRWCGFQESVTRARGLTLFKVFNAGNGFAALRPEHPYRVPPLRGSPSRQLGPHKPSSAPFGLGQPLRLHPASVLAELAVGTGAAGSALDLIPCREALCGFRRHQGFASQASSPVRCSGLRPALRMRLPVSPLTPPPAKETGGSGAYVRPNTAHPMLGRASLRYRPSLTTYRRLTADDCAEKRTKSPCGT